mgnify:CR=1 FL=1
MRNEGTAIDAAMGTESLPGRDVLWQEYLPGPESGVGLIGNPAEGMTALPPLEVDFSQLPAGLNPILSFESKADPDSPYWSKIAFHRASIDDATAARLTGWAGALFGRLGLQDYGRFDFRCAADGRPKLMEVNPNPAWANDGKLASVASHAAIAYPRMLEMIINAAINRPCRGPPQRPRGTGGSPERPDSDAGPVGIRIMEPSVRCRRNGRHGRLLLNAFAAARNPMRQYLPSRPRGNTRAPGVATTTPPVIPAP